MGTDGLMKAGFVSVAPLFLLFLQTACRPAPRVEGDEEREEPVRQESPEGVADSGERQELSREPFEVWLCPMHQDQRATTPGYCPTCQHEMVQRFLIYSYSCPMHSDVDEEQPGSCPVCSMDLVVTTRAARWVCPDDPQEVRSVPGGFCSESGAPMVLESIPLAHGDHNARHGGIVFMVAEGHYHIEGVLDPEGEFRVYFYDEFTRPIDAGDFAARIGSRSLERGQGTAYLRTFFDPPETYPVEVPLHVRFPTTDEEHRFDFLFAQDR